MTPALPAPQHVTTFGYEMAFILGFVLLVVLIILASYLSDRGHRHSPAPLHPIPQSSPPQTIISGINESTLLTYLEILYSCAKVEHNGNAWPSRSICLGDYKESAPVRLLPSCWHFFHTKCVNPWLRLNPTCRACRKLQSGEQAR